MKSPRLLVSYLVVAALLAAAWGCGAKPSAEASASAKATPAASAAQSAPPGGESSAGKPAEPSAAASAPTEKPSPSPSPSPAPSPTETPLGTIVDGWVVGIPEYVPRFACGKLDRSQSVITQGSTGTLFSLCFRGVAQADLEAYAGALRGAGFQAAAMQAGSSYTLTACLEGEWVNATLVVAWNEATGVAVYSLDVPV